MTSTACLITASGYPVATRPARSPWTRCITPGSAAYRLEEERAVAFRAKRLRRGAAADLPPVVQAGAFLPLVSSDHQRHEYGLIENEQHQQDKSRHYSTDEHKGNA